MPGQITPILKKTLGPTIEPVTLAEAKDHLRVTAEDTTQDVIVQSLIPRARATIEDQTLRQLLAATYRRSFGCWPRERIDLPRPPLQSVTSITYVDLNGVTQTLPTTEYQVVDDPEGAYIVPAYLKVWPVPRYQPEAVVVTFVAGYENAAAVPGPLRQAVLLLVEHLFIQTSPVVDTGAVPQELPWTIKQLIAPYVVLHGVV